MKEKTDFNPIILNRSENGQFFEAVSRNVYRTLLYKHGIKCENSDAQYTIFLTYLLECVNELKRCSTNDSEMSINMSDYITLSLDTSEREDGEMAGNIVPVITPGPALKTEVKNNGLTEDEEED